MLHSRGTTSGGPWNLSNWKRESAFTQISSTESVSPFARSTNKHISTWTCHQMERCHSCRTISHISPCKQEMLFCSFFSTARIYSPVEEITFWGPLHLDWRKRRWNKENNFVCMASDSCLLFYLSTYSCFTFSFPFFPFPCVSPHSSWSLW